MHDAPAGRGPGGDVVRPGAREAFARRLRILMVERRESIQDLARRASEQLPDGESISAATISRYRQGRAAPRLCHLEALGIVLQVSLSDLLSELADAEEWTTRTKGCAKGAAGELDPRGHSESRPEGAYRPVLLVAGLETARLTIDQQVSWETALKVLEILKDDRAGGSDDSTSPP